MQTAAMRELAGEPEMIFIDTPGIGAYEEISGYRPPSLWLEEFHNSYGGSTVEFEWSDAETPEEKEQSLSTSREIPPSLGVLQALLSLEEAKRALENALLAHREEYDFPRCLILEEPPSAREATPSPLQLAGRSATGKSCVLGAFVAFPPVETRDSSSGGTAAPSPSGEERCGCGALVSQAQRFCGNCGRFPHNFQSCPSTPASELAAMEGAACLPRLHPDLFATTWGTFAAGGDLAPGSGDFHYPEARHVVAILDASGSMATGRRPPFRPALSDLEMAPSRDERRPLIELIIGPGGSTGYGCCREGIAPQSAASGKGLWMSSGGMSRCLVRQLEAWVSGDTTVFGELCERLWERLYGPVFRYTLSLGLPRDTATDAVADGFWQAISSLERNVPTLLESERTEAELTGWFYRAWTFRILDEARRWHGYTRRKTDLHTLETEFPGSFSQAHARYEDEGPEAAFVRKRKLHETLAKLDALAVDPQQSRVCRQLLADTVEFLRLQLLASAGHAETALRREALETLAELADRLDVTDLEIDGHAWRDFLRTRLAARLGIEKEDPAEAARLRNRVDQQIVRCRQQLNAVVLGLV